MKNTTHPFVQPPEYFKVDGKNVYTAEYIGNWLNRKEKLTMENNFLEFRKEPKRPLTGARRYRCPFDLDVDAYDRIADTAHVLCIDERELADAAITYALDHIRLDFED